MRNGVIRSSSLPMFIPGSGIMSVNSDGMHMESFRRLR